MEEFIERKKKLFMDNVIAMCAQCSLIYTYTRTNLVTSSARIYVLAYNFNSLNIVSSHMIMFDRRWLVCDNINGFFQRLRSRHLCKFHICIFSNSYCSLNNYYLFIGDIRVLFVLSFQSLHLFIYSIKIVGPKERINYRMNDYDVLSNRIYSTHVMHTMRYVHTYNIS